jgi:hypothetical protein
VVPTTWQPLRAHGSSCATPRPRSDGTQIGRPAMCDCCGWSESQSAIDNASTTGTVRANRYGDRRFGAGARVEPAGQERWSARYATPMPPSPSPRWETRPSSLSHTEPDKTPLSRQPTGHGVPPALRFRLCVQAAYAARCGRGAGARHLPYRAGSARCGGFTANRLYPACALSLGRGDRRSRYVGRHRTQFAGGSRGNRLRSAS